MPNGVVSQSSTGTQSPWTAAVASGPSESPWSTTVDVKRDGAWTVRTVKRGGQVWSVTRERPEGDGLLIQTLRPGSLTVLSQQVRRGTYPVVKQGDSYETTFLDSRGRVEKTELVRILEGRPNRAGFTWMKVTRDERGRWVSGVIKKRLDGHNVQRVTVDESGKVLSTKVESSGIATVAAGYRKYAPYVAAALQFVPVYGQIAGGVIAAGYLVLGALEGKKLDPQRIAEVRAALSDEMGPEGQAAFDVGVTVATGEVPPEALEGLELSSAERKLVSAAVSEAHKRLTGGEGDDDIVADALAKVPERYRAGLAAGMAVGAAELEQKRRAGMRGFLVKRGVRPQFGTWRPSATGERYFVVMQDGSIRADTFLVKRPPVVANAPSSVPGMTIGQREAALRERLLSTTQFEQAAEFEQRAQAEEDPRMKVRLYMVALTRFIRSDAPLAQRREAQRELEQVKSNFDRGIYTYTPLALT